MSLWNYHINEYAVESEFPFPADAADGQGAVAAGAGGRPRLRVCRRPLHAVAAASRRFRPQLSYDTGDGILVDTRRVALHVARTGDRLCVDAGDADLSVACAWVIHVGLAAVTLMRGGLPLHAGGIEVAGRCVALIAPSGTGKSTLCWHLVASGAARFACDDVLSVELPPAGAAHGGPVAHAAVSLYPKLNRDAADRLAVPWAERRRAEDGTGDEEYWVSLAPGQRAAAAAPLGAVALLAPEADWGGSGVDAERLDPAAAAAVLAANLHGVWAMERFLDARRIAARCARLAAAVPVYRLRYRRRIAGLPALGDAVLRVATAGTAGTA